MWYMYPHNAQFHDIASLYINLIPHTKNTSSCNIRPIIYILKSPPHVIFTHSSTLEYHLLKESFSVNTDKHHAPGYNQCWMAPARSVCNKNINIICHNGMKCRGVRQMSPWWAKDLSQSIHTWGNITNVVSLYSVYQVPSHEPSFNSIVLVSTKMAYYSMRFILAMAYTTCSADHLKDK